ncbi:peptidoglycan DD-metalloendopeptidase family protein [Variovorax ginsengisoli]|uniref:Lipoprotein NlpD n=1 Tax=Variovorax ginsengisoli TaxID=363844 RepID=A0ABT9S6V3_9BURK|nr:peptidoglycan DD-metalloendopeptidase family protein [Variovorax ginsengisoli]MDP9900086.1 lipoprotein NlpD [Variovorax ginsengisoli]
MHASNFPIRSSLVALTALALVACSTPPGSGTATPSVGGATPGKAASTFVRPASGTTIARFDGNRNKGIDIAGSAGDPIVATADGRVVYVGSELRGYGNMVIVKHNETFLSAYAHAQKILVKEKDVVRQGQTIAEMGSTGTDRVKLHFEIRKQGTAVNPEPYLNGQAR